MRRPINSEGVSCISPGLERSAERREAETPGQESRTISAPAHVFADAKSCAGAQFCDGRCTENIDIDGRERGVEFFVLQKIVFRASENRFSWEVRRQAYFPGSLKIKVGGSV